ncbi:MAG: hypothetical protein ACREFE_04900 [Limisphaerales bacterium]
MNAQPKVRCLLAMMISIVGLSVLNARAFSLLGPFESWMTFTNGFYPSDEDEIGGPMCISNEYRWNVPVVTYGFDQSFLDYFGTNGVAAVESAIAVLNNLPSASQMDASNYLTDATYYNYTAQSQGLIDLKSETLFLLVEHLGLASPSIGAFCLKDFWFTNGTITGDVLRRNFDPFTDLPSNYIGDTLLSYQLQYSVFGSETNAWADVFPVDPLDSDPTTVANGVPEAGAFFGGLTCDDVGGLRYLYSTNNINYEILPSDVRGVNGSALVNAAWRPGIDKITFVPQPIDALSGAFLPATNQFTDTYITNGNIVQQQLERVTVQPDFLFCATNLANNSYLFSRTETTNWLNESALNGNSSPAGPGVIVPPVRISFNKLGKTWNSLRGSPDDSANVQTVEQWGTYDGSTNVPVAYPQLQTGTNQTTIQMTLMLNNASSEYSWQMAGAADADFNFQTSTNLSDWVTLFVVSNDGSVNSYINWNPSSIQRFYRIAPQNQ